MLLASPSLNQHNGTSTGSNSNRSEVIASLPGVVVLAKPWMWAQRTFGPYGFLLATGWWMHCVVLAGNGLVCGAFNTSVLYVLKSSYR